MKMQEKGMEWKEIGSIEIKIERKNYFDIIGS